MTDGATLGDSIIYIADKLEMPVAHVYEVIVKAQPLIAMLDFIEAILAIVAYIISVIMIHKYMIKCHNEKYATRQYKDDPDMMFITMMSVMLSIFPAIMVLIVADYAATVVMAFYMPEYLAIHKIAHMLGMGF